MTPDVDAAQGADLSTRLAEIEVERGNGMRAYDLMSGIDVASLSEAQIGLKFSAALLAGRFDDAAAIEADPGAWVDHFSDMVDRTPDDALETAVVALRDEIVRRFDTELDGEVPDRLRGGLPPARAADG